MVPLNKCFKKKLNCCVNGLQMIETKKEGCPFSKNIGGRTSSSRTHKIIIPLTWESLISAQQGCYVEELGCVVRGAL